MSTKIKILAPIHHTLDKSSQDTLFLQNLIPELKKRVDVELHWLIYTPNKLINQSSTSQGIYYHDIHCFKNAASVVKTINPDLVLASPFPNIIDYSLSLASRKLGILVIGYLDSDLSRTKNHFSVFKNSVAAFLIDSTPSDSSEKKKLMTRGRFFLYKYNFLFKTQLAIKLNIFKVISDFFIFLKYFLFETKYALYPKFSCDVNFVDGVNSYKKFLESGFKSNTLMLTGNPIYDKIFKNIKQKNTSPKNQIKILIITTGLYEHGLCSKFQRDSTITQIISELKTDPSISVVIKIHPSNEKLSEYREIVNKIDNKIPIFQFGEMIEYLDNCDVVIAIGSTSALYSAAFARIPIIYCDFFKILKREILIEYQIARECRDPKNLIKIIKEEYTKPISISQLNNFIKEFFYKDDGLASERIAKIILEKFNEKKQSY